MTETKTETETATTQEPTEAVPNPNPKPVKRKKSKPKTSTKAPAKTNTKTSAKTNTKTSAKSPAKSRKKRSPKPARKAKRYTRQTAKRVAPAKAHKRKRERLQLGVPAATRPAPVLPKSTGNRNWDFDFVESDVLSSFARNLREARIAAGFTQRKLADIMAYSRIAVCNMERGANGATLPTLLRICSVLKTDPTTLLRKRT